MKVRTTWCNSMWAELWWQLLDRHCCGRRVPHLQQNLEVLGPCRAKRWWMEGSFSMKIRAYSLCFFCIWGLVACWAKVLFLVSQTRSWVHGSGSSSTWTWKMPLRLTAWSWTRSFWLVQPRSWSSCQNGCPRRRPHCSSVLPVMVLARPSFTRNVMAKAPQWSLPRVREATFLVATPKRHGTALAVTKTAVIPSCSVCLDLVWWAHRNIASSRTSRMGSTAIPLVDPPLAAEVIWTSTTPRSHFRSDTPTTGMAQLETSHF